MRGGNSAVIRKRKPHHDEHIDETWLIPYADLLTLLLALFIVLFASSQIDAEKFKEVSTALNSAFSGNISFFENTETVQQDVNVIGDREEEKEKDEDNPNPAEQEREEMQNQLMERINQETEDLEDLKGSVDVYITENNLGSELDTELNSTQLKIVIQDNALFDSGSAAVKPQARLLAQAISELLVDYPNYDVVVAGHTDNDPIVNGNSQFRSNWDLSVTRAVNFMKILLNNQQLDPSRFSSTGFGEYQPIADNDTSTGKAKNRRVEVLIKRNISVPDSENIMLMEDAQ